MRSEEYCGEYLCNTPEGVVTNLFVLQCPSELARFVEGDMQSKMPTATELLTPHY